MPEVTSGIDPAFPTVFFYYNGLEEGDIEAFHALYNTDKQGNYFKKVNLVGVGTVPANWEEGDFGHNDPAHVVGTAGYIFDGRVDHMFLVKPHPEFGYPSVETLADMINAMGLNIKGEISHPWNDFILEPMGELHERVRGLEIYPTAAQNAQFTDKAETGKFLRALNSDRKIEVLIIPWESSIEGTGPDGTIAGLDELRQLVREKIEAYKTHKRQAGKEQKLFVQPLDEDGNIIKGERILVRTDDPMIVQMLGDPRHQQRIAKALKEVAEMDEEDNADDYELVLKARKGVGSMSVVKISNAMSDQDFEKALAQHWKELQAVPPAKSLLQEGFGKIELGAQTFMNTAPDGTRLFHHMLALKETHGTHGSKEVEWIFYDGGIQYRKWCKLVFPLMETIMEEAFPRPVKIASLNADIGYVSGQTHVTSAPHRFRPTTRGLAPHNAGFYDLNGSRIGLHTEALGERYRQLCLAMQLDLGDAPQAHASLSRFKQHGDRVMATINPEGGCLLLANVTDARMEAIRAEGLGVIDIRLPYLVPGDNLPAIESLLSVAGHINVIAEGDTEKQARKNARNGLIRAGVTMIRNGGASLHADGSISCTLDDYRDKYDLAKIQPNTFTVYGASDEDIMRIARAINYGMDEDFPERLIEVTARIHMYACLFNDEHPVDDLIQQYMNTVDKKWQYLAYLPIPEGQEDITAEQRRQYIQRLILEHSHYMKLELLMSGRESAFLRESPALRERQSVNTAIADGFSPTQRTIPVWNGNTVPYTVVPAPTAPVRGRQWGSSVGPEALLQSRERFSPNRAEVAAWNEFRGQSNGWHVVYCLTPNDYLQYLAVKIPATETSDRHSRLAAAVKDSPSGWPSPPPRSSPLAKRGNTPARNDNGR